MRIQDAKPGDVLRDKDGIVWRRTKKGATDTRATGAMPSRGFSLWWPSARLALVDTAYGPFTRLVPEQETP